MENERKSMTDKEDKSRIKRKETKARKTGSDKRRGGREQWKMKGKA